MAHEVNDRRSLKTRAALHAAFVDLLLARGYEALQVGEVSDRANVGRSTFYEHFGSKADLLRASLATPFGHLAGMVLPGASPAGIVPWLQHFREHRPVVRVLLGWPTRPLLSQTLGALVADRLRERDEAGAGGFPVELTARLVADAQLALLDIWIGGRPAAGAEDIAAALRRASAALAGALGGAPERSAAEGNADAG